VIFEEASQFDQKTVDSVLVAIRGIKYQTTIFRSNPYLLSNWFVRSCYKQVMIDEDWMLNGNGNQLEEKEGVIYHYMQVRCFSTTSTLLKSITPWFHSTLPVYQGTSQNYRCIIFGFRTISIDPFCWSLSDYFWLFVRWSLCLQKTNGSTQFKFEQSTIHSSYLLHLFSLIFDYCGAFLRIMERNDKRYQRHSYSLWFYTLSLP
jgi:hypothetical protein